MEKFEKIKQAQKEYREAVKAVGKDDFIALLAPLFEKYPEIQAVRWRQYTPSFNDGDPCRFSVHDTYFRFNDTGEEDGDYEDGFEGYFEDKARQDIVREFDRALAVDKNIMEMVFGDPAMVTIDRKGIEIDEYYPG